MLKKFLIFIALVIVVLIVVIVMVMPKKDPRQISPVITPNNQMEDNNESPATENIPSETVVSEVLAEPSSVSVIPASLSIKAGEAGAPKQEVIETDKIPAKAIKLEVSDSGFVPKEFTVKAGQETILAITTIGDNAHVFLFPNAALMGLATTISPGETKLVTFTAPVDGSYIFRDDIPKYRDNTGLMIVETN